MDLPTIPKLHRPPELTGSELGRVDDKLQQLQAIVNLYRSLGGGWE